MRRRPFMRKTTGPRLKLCGGHTLNKVIWKHNFGWPTITCSIASTRKPKLAPRWWTSCEPQPIEVTPMRCTFLSHCSKGQERDALLLKAGELGSLDAQRDLGALYATGNWTGPKDSVHPSGGTVERLNAATVTRNTISDSCICLGRACKAIPRKVCDGSVSRLRKERATRCA